MGYVFTRNVEIDKEVVEYYPFANKDDYLAWYRSLEYFRADEHCSQQYYNFYAMYEGHKKGD